MLDQYQIKFNKEVFSDEDFFDRDDDISSICTFLRNKAGKPGMIITGERTSGKTSLHKRVKEILQNDENIIFINIGPFDIDSLGKFKHELWDKAVNCRELMLQNIPDSEGYPLEKLFINHLERKIVAVIDEMDPIWFKLRGLTPQDPPSDQMMSILGYMNLLLEQNSEIPLRFLVTVNKGIGFPIHELRKFDNILVKPFRDEKLAELLDGLDQPDPCWLTDNEKSEIRRLGGGWPHYTKLMLEALANEPRGPHWMENATKNALRHSSWERNFEHVYKDYLDNDQRAILLLVAVRNGNLLKSEIDVLTPAQQSALSALLERDYLEISTDGNCIYKIGLLTAWFRNWRRYKEEVDNRLKDTLIKFKRLEDPWAGSY